MSKPALFKRIRLLGLAAQSAQHFVWRALALDARLAGPTNVFVQQAQGATLRCADGLAYSDFAWVIRALCFSHSPRLWHRLSLPRPHHGLTTMLPSTPNGACGRATGGHLWPALLALALSASDANRFVLRWARAVTRRRMVLVLMAATTALSMTPWPDCADGATVPRPSVLGSAQPRPYTRVVPFNDLGALEQALADGRSPACWPSLP